MAHTLYEAAKLSRNPLARGVLTAIATTDEFLSQVPMQGMQGESFSYNREKALPSVEFVSPTHTSVAESSATFDQVTVPMRMIVSDVDVYLFAEQQQGDINAQRAVQLEKKLKALGRTLGQKLITGAFVTSATFAAALTGVTFVSAGPGLDSDRHGPGLIFYDQSETTLQFQAPGDVRLGAAVDVGSNGTYTLPSDNPSKFIRVTVVTGSLAGADVETPIRFASTTNEFDGLQKFTTTGQTISSTAADGDDLSFNVLDKLIEKVKVRTNRHFVMPDALKTKFYSLVRALGGSDPQVTTLPGVNGPVPVYRGIPLLTSDWIPATESKGASSTLSSVYLVSCAYDEGLYFGTAGRGGSQMADISPMAARVMGVQLRDVGELESKEAMRTRLSWYGASALGSELAVARASELKTA